MTLDDLKALRKKATQGEWKQGTRTGDAADAECIFDNVGDVITDCGARSLIDGYEWEHCENNSAFIATLVNWFDLPSTQAMLEKGERKLDAGRLFCEAIVATQDGTSGRMVCDVEKLLAHFNASKNARKDQDHE